MTFYPFLEPARRGVIFCHRMLQDEFGGHELSRMLEVQSDEVEIYTRDSFYQGLDVDPRVDWVDEYKLIDACVRYCAAVECLVTGGTYRSLLDFEGGTRIVADDIQDRGIFGCLVENPDLGEESEVDESIPF